MGFTLISISAHRPRKRFGQHFLRDRGVVERIVRAVTARAGDDARLVEIGPGRGVLTAPLLRALAPAPLTAIEIDRDLVALLRRRDDLSGLDLIEADALDVDYRALAAAHPSGRLRLVGNLPYNISTPLLFRLFGASAVIVEMHFMLQREVVQRLAAAPGQASYGRLSIMVQYYCQVDALFEVGPGAFTPPPRVDSAVVRLTPHRRAPVAVRDPERLAALVGAAFSQRRKTLRNSLKNLLDGERIAAAGVDPGARPETLGLADFARLCEQLDLSDQKR